MRNSLGFRFGGSPTGHVFFSPKVWLRPGLAPLVLLSPGPVVPGALVPCPWSPSPLVPWILGFSGFSASVASWLQWLRGSWLLGFGGFLASRLQWLLASWLRWLLGFSGLKQLHFQDGYMSLSPNSTCHFCRGTLTMTTKDHRNIMNLFTNTFSSYV